MLSCFDVAKYFLAQADEDAGDLIPHSAPKTVTPQRNGSI